MSKKHGPSSPKHGPEAPGRFAFDWKYSVVPSKDRAGAPSAKVLLTTGPRYTGSDHGSEVLARVETIRSSNGRAGRRDKALPLLKEFGQQESGDYMKAYAHIGIGDFDGAFEELEGVYERRAYLFTINREPLMQPLRADPRFHDLLRRMGLPTEKPATVGAARPRDAKSESAR